jgi:hypothetical protein
MITDMYETVGFVLMSDENNIKKYKKDNWHIEINENIDFVYIGLKMQNKYHTPYQGKIGTKEFQTELLKNIGIL